MRGSLQLEACRAVKSLGQWLAHREKLVTDEWPRAFQHLRGKQMPVLTVANPHGSIVIGHGDEVVHIRPR